MTVCEVGNLLPLTRKLQTRTMLHTFLPQGKKLEISCYRTDDFFLLAQTMYDFAVILVGSNVGSLRIVSRFRMTENASIDPINFLRSRLKYPHENISTYFENSI